MVAPARVGDVHLGARRQELLVELGRETERTGARERLHRCDPVGLDGLRRVSVGEAHGVGHKLGHARLRSVLLVLAAVDQPLLRLRDRRKHPRHALVCPVGADDEVDLVGSGARLKVLGDAEDAVGRALRDGGQVGRRVVAGGRHGGRRRGASPSLRRGAHETRSE